MRRAKLGLTLLASSCAICAVAYAGVAQALPEFLAKGKPITKVAFTAKAGAGSVKTSSTSLTWSGASAEGSIEGADKISGLTLRFTGDKIGGCEVNSPKAKAGEVITKTLQGKLGYINKATPTVGALFEPAAGSKTPFGEIEVSKCTAALTLTGSVIGKVGPLNKESISGEFAFGASGKKQEVTKFEGEATEHLLSIGELPGVFECDEGLLFAEKVEVKA